MLDWRTIVNGMLIIYAALLTGCTGTSEPTSFFMLSPIMEGKDLRDGGREISVLVGPVYVAAYLDRSQIIARQTGVEVTVHDFDQWAEPLDKNVKRVLIANLSAMLGSTEVYDFENSNSPATKFQLQVEVYRLDFVEEGAASFDAFWTIYDSRGRIVRRNKTQMTRMASGKDMASLVAAQNMLLTDFTKDVAEELISLNVMDMSQRESIE